MVGKHYWAELVAAEVAANGHGDQFSEDAGRIAICESWAEYLGGLQYTRRTYGTDNSVPNNWEVILERTWNEVPNHIPIGLHHDLIDIGEPTFRVNRVTVSACNLRSPGWTLIDDRVDGFSNSQLFQSLGRSVTTVQQYRQQLISNYLGSTTNTLEELNALFSSY